MALISTFPGGGTGGGGQSDDQLTLIKDVNFYDYDGTLLHTYTLAQANALTQLPAPPEQDGLIFQGWNYTLEEVQNTTRLMDIGALYITDDGRTRLVIRLEDVNLTSVPLVFYQTVSNGVAVDWGDGSSETVEGQGQQSIMHQYQATGEYTISLDVTSGVITFGDGDDSILGDSHSIVLQKVFVGSGATGIASSAFYRCHSLKAISLTTEILSFEKDCFYSCHLLRSITIPSGTTALRNYAFRACNSLQMLSLPNSVTSLGVSTLYECYSLSAVQLPDHITSLDKNGLHSCYALRSFIMPKGVTVASTYLCFSCYTLKSVTLPQGLTALNNYSFGYCYTLESIVIPDSVESIGTCSFINCYSLASVQLPAGLKTIGDRAFASCGCLSSITIPQGVTSIGVAAFYENTHVRSYYFKPTTPPALADSAVFQGICADCIIYVPVGSLEAYQTAAIFSIHADKIQEESV